MKLTAAQELAILYKLALELYEDSHQERQFLSNLKLIDKVRDSLVHESRSDVKKLNEMIER